MLSYWDIFCSSSVSRAESIERRDVARIDWRPKDRKKEEMKEKYIDQSKTGWKQTNLTYDTCRNRVDLTNFTRCDVLLRVVMKSFLGKEKRSR